jgi:hypothetical protein
MLKPKKILVVFMGLSLDAEIFKKTLSTFDGKKRAT